MLLVGCRPLVLTGSVIRVISTNSRNLVIVVISIVVIDWQVLDVSSMVLKPNGMLWMELYAESSQHRSVEEYIARHHATELVMQEVVLDLGDMPRFVLIRKVDLGGVL